MENMAAFQSPTPQFPMNDTRHSIPRAFRATVRKSLLLLWSIENGIEAFRESRRLSSSVLDSSFRPKRWFEFVPRAAVSMVALFAMLSSQVAWAADTVATFSTLATDLTVGTNYAPNITPTAATTNDILLSGAYTTTTLTDSSATGLVFGTLNDADTTQTLTILDNGSAGSIQLSTASNNTGTTGAASASDLLFVKSGANLIIGGGSAALTLKTNVTGNIDDAGTLAIKDVLSVTAGTTLSFTGAGATTVGGNIAATSGALTVNDSGGSVTLSGVDAYTGATTVTAGTLNLNGGSLTGATAIAVNGGTFLENSSGVIGSAAASLTVGGGTAILAGANTYTGNTALNSGTLDVNSTRRSARWRAR